MENLELMNLTPDKINVRTETRLCLPPAPGRAVARSFSLSFCLLKGQKRSSDILTKQSKPSLAKSSTKLFFVSRLRGKKYKTSGSSKVLQDTSNTLDTSQGPAQVPQKVPQINTSFLVSRILSCSAAFISPCCFCVVLAPQS